MITVNGKQLNQFHATASAQLSQSQKNLQFQEFQREYLSKLNATTETVAALNKLVAAQLPNLGETKFPLEPTEFMKKDLRGEYEKAGGMEPAVVKGRLKNNHSTTYLNNSSTSNQFQKLQLHTEQAF